MTVNELIKLLNDVKNKEQKVTVEGCDCIRSADKISEAENEVMIRSKQYEA